MSDAAPHTTSPTTAVKPGEVPPPADARPFRPDIDIAELSDRSHPGHSWSGRGESLSTSHFVFRSRSLCYVGRRLAVAVHLIDAQPAILVGKVVACEYQGECQHRTVLQLEPIPAESKLTDWVHGRGPKRK